MGPVGEWGAVGGQERVRGDPRSYGAESYGEGSAGPRGVMGPRVKGRGLRDPMELWGRELRGGVCGTPWSYGARSYGEGSAGPCGVTGL